MASPTAVMMSDTVKKNVVFSAECFNEGYKPPGSQCPDSSTQLLVEYSVMPLGTGPMTEENKQDVIKKIDGTIDIIKGCLAIGSFAFPPAAGTLAFIAGCGSAIQWLMGKIPDERETEVVKRYKLLEAEIKKLEEKMVAHFADMQAFISEHNFDVHIKTEASTLMRFMRNCLKSLKTQDVKNFKLIYDPKPPLTMTYSMTSLLNNRSTNPLIKAMESEKVKTKATFNKWKNIITGILGEFLFIETFASGLLNKTLEDGDSILEEWNNVTTSLVKWENEFKSDEEYWKQLKVDFEKYITDNTKLSKMQKAEEIKKRLDKYLTSDTFFICVFNEASWGNQYNYNFSPNLIAEQLIMNVNKGGCCAFVYRSRTAWKMSKDDYVKMKDQVANASSKIGWGGLFSKIYDDYYRNMAGGYELYFLMIPSCDAAVCYSDANPVIKWDGFNYTGPGAHTKLPLSAPQYYSIVAFK